MSIGDFIRYIITSGHEITLALVEEALQSFDGEFSIFRDQAATNSGDIVHGSDVYGEIEVNRAGEQVFVEDIEDLRDQLTDTDDDANSDGVAQALETLDGATAMVAVQLAEAGHEHYSQIDPLWDWLFARYPGLLQIDEEGYYSKDELILAVE